MDPTFALCHVHQTTPAPVSMFSVRASSTRDKGSEDVSEIQQEPTTFSDNPFASLDTSPFARREALVLANIDAVYRVTGKIGLGKTYGPFFFMHLYRRSGFSDYVFYRRPEAKGVGVSLAEDLPNSKANGRCFQQLPNIADSTDGFKVVDGESKPQATNEGGGKRKATDDQTTVDGESKRKATDDQTTVDKEQARDTIGKFFPTGMHLAMSDSDDTEDVDLAFRSLRLEGDLVVRMVDTSSPSQVQKIMDLARLFESIDLFKPASTPFSSPEVYLVCKKKQTSNTPITGFVSWIVDKNKDIAKARSMSVSPNEYLLYCAYVYWDIQREV